MLFQEKFMISIFCILRFGTGTWYYKAFETKSFCMHILQTVLYTFPKVLPRRIC